MVDKLESEHNASFIKKLFEGSRKKINHHKQIRKKFGDTKSDKEAKVKEVAENKLQSPVTIL